MSGIYSDWIETVRDKRHRTRIACDPTVSHSFPIPLGAEIGKLDRTVTTNVVFLAHMPLILLLLLAAAACI